MPSTQQFRKRIRSVKNTSQITRAMEMVASVKMQKAVKAILSNRTYMQSSWNLLVKIAQLVSSNNHPLMQKREINKVCLVIAGSDRGLCGSYLADMTKRLFAYLDELAIPKENLDVIVTGKKTAEIARKLGLNLIAEFASFELDVDFWESRPISKLIMDGYENKQYDRIDVLYSHFVSSLCQTPVIKQVLPISKKHIDKPELWEPETSDCEQTEFKFEPDADAVVSRLLPQFIRAQMWGAMLEANASEHSARMVAMKNATDNAKELIDDLTLTYNSIRQDSITREIAEIAGAAEAMK